MNITVNTQEELSAAVDDSSITHIQINATNGVFSVDSDRTDVTILVESGRLNASGSVRINAALSARVWASGSVDVHAFNHSNVSVKDRCRIQAYGESRVRARGRADVRAADVTRVVACEDATVRTSGRATVRGRDRVAIHASGESAVVAMSRATVRAGERSLVEAEGRVAVQATGQATVILHDDAHASVFDAVTVFAHGRGSVHAAGHSTVHSLGSPFASRAITAGSGAVVRLRRGQPRSSVKGAGTAIYVNNDPWTVKEWLNLHGLIVEDGRVTLIKGVNPDLETGHGYEAVTRYPIGETVTAEDWRDDSMCGHGLHLCSNTQDVLAYRAYEGTRFLEVSVAVEDVRVIGADKVKVPTLRVEREIDFFGRPVGPSEAGTDPGRKG